MEKENTHLVGVYGSLREGLWLRDSFADEMTPVKTIVLDGFQMHSTGHYPVVTPGEETEKIIVEIVEVNDRTLRSLDGVELGAGYARETIKYKDEEFFMYIYQHPTESYLKVEDGDWTSYYGERITYDDERRNN